MNELAKDETSYLTRLQLQLQRTPSVGGTVAKELETLVEYRKGGQLAASEFFVELKRIECVLEAANGVSRETFLAFVNGELSRSHASKETFARVAQLVGKDRHELSAPVVSQVCDCCLLAWRDALDSAARDAKSGRSVSKALIWCLLAYMVLTKTGPVISEATSLFSAEISVPVHSPFWHLATDSIIRVMSFLTTSGEFAPIILGMAGAALSLFRKRVRTYEISLMFPDQIRWSNTIHLAIGAWSGFFAGYLLRFLSSSVATNAQGGLLLNFLLTVGCFAAGYSTWFIDTAVERVWRALKVPTHTTNDHPSEND
jgi:hypothetical protein